MSASRLQRHQWSRPRPRPGRVEELLEQQMTLAVLNDAKQGGRPRKGRGAAIVQGVKEQQPTVPFLHGVKSEISFTG